LQEPRPGAFIAQLRHIETEKGSLREIWRDDNPFGTRVEQAYITTTHPNVVKAWYIHAEQTDQITTVAGKGRLVIWDPGSDTPVNPVVIELDAARPTFIVIPPGFWHGFQALGEQPMMLLHLNNLAFDHVRTDELRLPADDPSIPYRWPQSP
jgi:dTDP-4-dehydrorhamnose 3,5-epimerase